MSKFVVWPNEIDSRLPRKYGRVIPKTVAVKAPSLREIEDASAVLGFRIIEKDPTKLNPRLAGVDEEYRTPGRLVIESQYGKSKSLRMIAEKIRELRKRTEVRKSKRKKR